MFCFRGNVKCVACVISGGVRCTDCTGALKEGLRETMSALVSAVLVLYYKGEGLGEKVVILQAGVKGITNPESSTGKWCGKISLTKESTMCVCVLVTQSCPTLWDS